MGVSRGWEQRYLAERREENDRSDHVGPTGIVHDTPFPSLNFKIFTINEPGLDPVERNIPVIIVHIAAPLCCIIRLLATDADFNIFRAKMNRANFQ